MLNFNGKLIAKNEFNLNYSNRAFAYGDAIFDTSKFIDNEVSFLEDHYFRLMASMRMLRMEIPLSFTMPFFENEILKTIKGANLKQARVKFTVFRKLGGFYTPNTNTVDFLIEVNKLNIKEKENYTVDLFKDYKVNSDLLSTIKTNNRIVNVVSSIYAKENNLDNSILINQDKKIVEANNANIFLIFGNKIITPPISDGCIKGIMRKKVIEAIQAKGEFLFEEKSVSPFDLQKADSAFLTNSIIEIQTITNYKKKKFNPYLVNMVKLSFKEYVDLEKLA